MASKILNLALYQAGWFLCVLGAAGGWAEWGAALALALVLLHLALVHQPAYEARLLFAGGALGLLLDTFQIQLGVLSFPPVPGLVGVAPFFILVLWLQFATLFHFCLAWLSGRYLLSAAVGIVGGPLSFLGGERLGAVTLARPLTESLPILALVWGLAIPALVAVADHQARTVGRPRYRVFR